MCGCKRSFGSFAVPLSPFKARYSNEELNAQKPEVQPLEQDFRARPIRELLAAGSDLAGKVFSLTNEIHPIFREKNICACENASISSCCSPYLAANPHKLADEKKAPTIAAPYPSQNPFVRVILQLATRLLTHDDSLPFWAGILDCARGPRQEVARFHVHPRKRLSAARRAETLDQLNKFADEVRIHFREFEKDGVVGEAADGFAMSLFVEEGDLDFDPATVSYKTCDHVSAGRFTSCDCPKGPVYAFRDGKPVIEDSRFQHIFMNTTKIKGFNAKTHPTAWQRWSIWDLQHSIFHTASVLCHEFAHAFLDFQLGRDAFMNDESLAETGYSWENFIFGGALHIEAYDEHSSLSIMPWPNLQQFESFMAISARMSIRYFGQLEYSRHLAVQPCQYGEFLHQKFWDEEKPDKVFKKMWLKPYLEAPQHETEFTYFNSGHEAPIQVSAKKRRLSNAAMDRARAYASKLRRSERMARADRWHRCREILLERKADFHDRAKDRLNALWTSCTPAIGEKMFRQ